MILYCQNCDTETIVEKRVICCPKCKNYVSIIFREQKIENKIIEKNEDNEDDDLMRQWLNDNFFKN